MFSLLKNVFNLSTLQITGEFTQTLDKFENTANNYFLTGNAGTGKSTLIHQFRNTTKKKVAVLAPTGLAAINVKGQTVHSFFHFPPRMLTADVIGKIRYGGRMYKQVDTIVIDEASMVRADMLDGIDTFLRKFGRDSNLPFGGIQIILVGDLFQLPPVVRNEDGVFLKQLYTTPYFFSAKAFWFGAFEKVELTQIFRQDDERFISILNKVRSGEVSVELLELLNKQVKKNGQIERKRKAVTLASTNSVVQIINQSELAQLAKPEYTYSAIIDGDFTITDNNMPVDLELKLRRGARVMFIKNSIKWVNGSLGVVDEVDDDHILVKMDDTGEVLEVLRETWEHIKYQYNDDTDRIDANVLGTLEQYPLRLAWAITIHKSQGMTFSKVNIDYSKSPFAHGQTYVALSRCKSLAGISLSKQLYPNDVIVDERVVAYLNGDFYHPDLGR